MAAVAAIAVGLFCSILSAAGAKGAASSPATVDRLRKTLPESVADFLPHAGETDDYDPVRAEEEEIQMLRNLYSAEIAEQDAAQADNDRILRNRAEDAAEDVQLIRGRNFKAKKRSTPCASGELALNKLKPDCEGFPMSQFKLTQCSPGSYRYDYTCLESNVPSQIGEQDQTMTVSSGGTGQYQTDINLKTLYKHEVRCDIGGHSRFENPSLGSDTAGYTPLNSFRYDYIDDGKFKSTTKYYFKCLDQFTRGHCIDKKSEVSVLPPNELLANPKGLQSLDVACPTTTSGKSPYVLTRFRLKSGERKQKKDGEWGDYTVPPLPSVTEVKDEEGKPKMVIDPGVYQYEFTCCEFE